MLKKTYNIFVLILIFGACNNAQKFEFKETQNDSLDSFLNIADNDSISYNNRLFYNNKALNLISSKTNDSINRINYFKVANRYFNIGDLENYKTTTWKIIKNSTAAKDSISLAKSYSYMIDYHIKFKNTDSTFWYNNQAEKLYKKNKDHLNIAKILLNKAILQHNSGDFIGGEKTAFEILNHLRFIDDAALLYEAYNLLGIIYAELAEYNLSKKYYNLALDVTNSSALSSKFQLKAITLNNLGVLYRYQSKDFDAIRIFKVAINQHDLEKDKPLTLAMLKDNLAHSKFKYGDLSNLPGLFYESLKIKDSLNDISGIILSKIHLSEYYAFKRDTLKAIKFAKEANFLARRNNDKKDLLNTLKQLSNSDPKNALKYSSEYFKIDDSIRIVENKARNKFARIEYETEELTIQKDKLIEQRKTLIYIGLSIILLGVLIFIIRFQATKNRELKLVQEQQKANEEIYQLMLNQQNKIEEVRQNEKKRIAQELHDGILGKLFGTRMNLGVLNSKKDDEAIFERGSYIDELKTLEQEIREISHDLNTEKTAVFNNFVLMVTNFFETQRKVCKADITFQIDPNIEWNTVDNMAKINFYRILQEAFQNINKHANALNVSVTFDKIESLIQLNIQDDGVGFVYARKKKGIGLMNMKARISDSGGEMNIETEPEKGTLLQFELPLNPNKNT